MDAQTERLPAHTQFVTITGGDHYQFGSFAAYAWLGSRKSLREAKNFERGLKMVPMLIHLPPPSADIDAGSRDNRDVAEEAISQARTLYDIIASTAQKGFKSNFYNTKPSKGNGRFSIY